MPTDLRGHDMAIGGKGAGFNQNRASRGRRAIKTGQQQVKIDAERIHRHHFLRLSAGQLRQGLLQRFGVADPTRVAPVREPRPPAAPNGRSRWKRCGALHAARDRESVRRNTAARAHRRRAESQIASAVARVRRPHPGSGRRRVVVGRIAWRSRRPRQRSCRAQWVEYRPRRDRIAPHCRRLQRQEVPAIGDAVGNVCQLSDRAIACASHPVDCCCRRQTEEYPMCRQRSAVAASIGGRHVQHQMLDALRDQPFDRFARQERAAASHRLQRICRAR